MVHPGNQYKRFNMEPRVMHPITKYKIGPCNMSWIADTMWIDMFKISCNVSRLQISTTVQLIIMKYPNVNSILRSRPLRVGFYKRTACHK